MCVRRVCYGRCSVVSYPSRLVSRLVSRLPQVIELDILIFKTLIHACSSDCIWVAQIRSSGKSCPRWHEHACKSLQLCVLYVFNTVLSVLSTVHSSKCCFIRSHSFYYCLHTLPPLNLIYCLLSTESTLETSLVTKRSVPKCVSKQNP